MLKFKAKTPDSELYGIGLTPANLVRLYEGLPISIELAEMQGPPIEILLMFGETEQDMVEKLKRLGLVDGEQMKLGECQCPRCTMARAFARHVAGADADAGEGEASPAPEAGSGPEYGASESEEGVTFQGAIRVNHETGEESSLGFDDLDPNFVAPLAAGFIVGWLRMPANEAVLEALLAELRDFPDAASRIAVIKARVLGQVELIPGARTLADKGYSLEEADWGTVDEVLGDVAKRQEAGRE